VVFDSLPKEEESQSKGKSDQGSKSSETAWQIKKEKIIEIIRKSWTEGQRQELAMCLAGFLAKQGIPWPEAANLILEVASLCNDSETRQRMAAIKATYEKDKKASGESYRGLEEMLRPEDLQILTSFFYSPHAPSVEQFEFILYRNTNLPGLNL